MMKKEYRCFFGFLDKQEQYLNRMAHNGFHLVHTGKISYTFETCRPDAYQYCLEFTAHLSTARRSDYQEFLEGLGCRVFHKNMNLNYSVGKIRWRPYGQGKGQIAANPGAYNKELFIVEKENDGKPFELHSVMEDKMDYYRPLRNAYLCLLVLLTVMAVLSPIGLPVFIFPAALLLIPTAGYQRRINRCRRESRIQD